MTRSISALGPLYELFRRYWTLMGWLLTDSAMRFQLRFGLVVFCGLAGLVSHMLAFLILGVYAIHFAEGTTMAFGEWEIQPRESTSALLAVGSIVCSALMCSSVLLYLSHIGTISLGRRYEEFCAQRILGILATKDHPSSGDASAERSLDGRSALRLCKKDSRLAGRCLRIITSAIAPLLMAVGAFIALFWIHAPLTFIVIAAGTVLLFVQYKFSRAAAYQSAAHEHLSRKAAAEYRRVTNRQEPTETNGDNANETAQKIVHTPVVQSYLESFEGRLRALAGSRLASQLFAAPTIILVLLVLGWEIIEAGGGWNRLLVYVIALRFAATGVEAGFLRLTSINRFYPQIRRYFLFIREGDAAPHPQGTN